ncbi:MAG: hypothetical protein KatS3mg113_0630 [Planctomycetaceae bacterium]|nr:MAG: hypothetical protein KatS3mg113_0630 [Planctomycetaceae bacterium]
MTSTGYGPLKAWEREHTLVFQRRGSLKPWIGHALRGAVGIHLRQQYCQQPKDTWADKWKYCKGCPYNHQCGYGILYEPDPPANVHVALGWQDAPRPLVMQPYFPAPRVVHPRQRLPLRIITLGEMAERSYGGLLDSLRKAGRNGRGLGQAQIQFEVETEDEGKEIAIRLPCPGEDNEEVLAKVTIVTPLIIKKEVQHGHKQVEYHPSFESLIRAGLRVIGPLYKFHLQALPDELLWEVKQAAMRVNTILSDYVVFRQSRHSSRYEPYMVQGVLGWGLYGPIPAWLATWLEWAGWLHVGNYRIAGCGRWQTIIARRQSDRSWPMDLLLRHL